MLNGLSSSRSFVTTTQPNSGVTTNTYDSRDVLTAVEDPLLQTTQVAYDGVGRLIKITNRLLHEGLSRSPLKLRRPGQHDKD